MVCVIKHFNPNIEYLLQAKREIEQAPCISAVLTGQIQHSKQVKYYRDHCYQFIVHICKNNFKARVLIKMNPFKLFCENYVNVEDINKVHFFVSAQRKLQLYQLTGGLLNLHYCMFAKKVHFRGPCGGRSAAVQEVEAMMYIRQR
jgi:hypothetical protein